MADFDKILKEMTFNFFGNGKHKTTSIKGITDKNSVFLDVRSKEETDTVSFDLVHHVPVIRIPINEIPERISELPVDKNIGIFCASGVRSTMVYLYLQAHKFDKVRIIEGGYSELVQELKPGKLLKHILENNSDN